VTPSTLAHFLAAQIEVAVAQPHFLLTCSSAGTAAAQGLRISSSRHSSSIWPDFKLAFAVPGGRVRTSPVT
jgi:hypothetical protein